MSSITVTLAKRLRVCTVSFPMTSIQHTVFSKPFNVDAMKQRTAEWEPTLSFSRLKPDSKRSNGDDNGENVTQMVTYSAFDPGASHPLLLSSALPIPIPSRAENTSTTSTLRQSVKTCCNSAVAMPAKQTMSATSSLHHAIPVREAAPVVAGEKFKPWPYSLPKWLQPKAGTTYDMTYGDGDGAVGKVKVGLLQKALYGSPEPDQVEEKVGGGRKKGPWQKVVNGS